MIRRRAYARLRIVAVLALLAGGCASYPYQVTYQIPGQYQKLGRAEGTACGVLLFGYSPLQFIPIMTTSRVERAYNNAVKSVPGALYLDDIAIDEYYFWLIGTVWCMTIEGEAVR